MLYEDAGFEKTAEEESRQEGCGFCYQTFWSEELTGGYCAECESLIALVEQLDNAECETGCDPFYEVDR